jgi:hypothetical protein
MKGSSIEEIEKKICKALNVDYNDFVKMTFKDQIKIRARYTTEISGLKFKQHK